MSFPITRFSLFPSYQLSSFPIYSFAPRHPARFLFYITDFFSPALPLRILFCKGNAGDCSNTKSSIAFDRKIFLCVRAYFSLPIWLFDRHHSWKAKNIPWAGRKSLRNKGRKNIRAMAHKNDYQIQKQLDKPQTWFCKYYPARIRNVGEKEIADRQLVFDSRTEEPTRKWRSAPQRIC